MPAKSIGKVRVFVNDVEITDYVSGISVDIGDDPQVSIWTEDVAGMSSEIMRPTFEIKFEGKWTPIDPCQGE